MCGVIEKLFIQCSLVTVSFIHKVHTVNLMIHVICSSFRILHRQSCEDVKRWVGYVEYPCRLHGKVWHPFCDISLRQQAPSHTCSKWLKAPRISIRRLYTSSMLTSTLLSCNIFSLAIIHYFLHQSFSSLVWVMMPFLPSSPTGVSFGLSSVISSFRNIEFAFWVL